MSITRMVLPQEALNLDTFPETASKLDNLVQSMGSDIASRQVLGVLNRVTGEN